MSISNDGKGPLKNLGRKVLSIGAALSALLAQQPPLNASPPFRLPHQVRTIQADDSSKRRAPLVLKSAAGRTNIILVGHRSHSSHRSHVSGSSGHSSHQSHVSSSYSPPIPTPSYVAPRMAVTTERPRAVPKHVPKYVEPPEPPPRADPVPAIDLSDPLERYHVTSFSRVKGEIRATIVDVQTELKSTVVEGDTLGTYKVSLVDMTNRIVKLQSPGQGSITLRLAKKTSF